LATARLVEPHLPELVATNENGLKAVHYHLLPFFLLQGVRELKVGEDVLPSENSQQVSDEQAQGQRLASLDEQRAALERAVSGQ
jgi:hypothetical protein